MPSTDVFVEEVQVPVAHVAFLNFGGFVSLLQFLGLLQSELYCGHSLMFR